MAIVFITLLVITLLIVLHEFGHFVLAKFFGVKVDEFGVGYPPRIVGKRIGETIYSLNLIPFGGFVRILGEEKKKDDPRSFSAKPIWQRMIIILGGVIIFWVIGFFLLSFLFFLGNPLHIDDSETGLLNPHIEIVGVENNSPAEKAGIKKEDVIKGLKIDDEKFIPISKVSRFQEVVKNARGKEITLLIERKGEKKEIKLVPRVSPPEGQGPLGIGIVRIGTKKSPFPYNFLDGARYTWYITKETVISLGKLFYDLISRKGMPEGAEPASVIGIFYFFYKAAQFSWLYFFQLVAIISIYLAVFNLLPIPALDGGKLFFLGIELIRGKPVPEKIENTITTFFFFLLIGLVIFVTFRFDIPRLIK